MTKAYITGANGFIGTHLRKHLRNNEIIAIPHSEINTTHLDSFDEFYFLSTYGNMYFHTEDEKIIQANILDLIQIIKQFPQKKFKSFIFTSTSSVGLDVQTMYSRCKKAAEEILLSYMDKYQLPICIVRPFTVIGVGEQKEHLIPTLIRSCLNGELINFVSHPVHDYIDVEDVVDGIVTLANNSAKGIYELGSEKSYSNHQVLEIVEKTTGAKANVNIVKNMRPYDSNKWVSSGSNIRKYGWLPKKSLEQSIEEMVRGYE